MDDDEIDDLLTAKGHGVLSLARGDEAYGLPVSYGYDGEDVYFTFLQFGPTTRKAEFARATETASLQVSGVRGRFDWRSVIVSGPIRELDDEWEALVAAMEDIARYPSSFRGADPMGELTGWILAPESVTGRAHEG